MDEFLVWCRELLKLAALILQELYVKWMVLHLEASLDIDGEILASTSSKVLQEMCAVLPLWHKEKFFSIFWHGSKKKNTSNNRKDQKVNFF